VTPKRVSTCSFLKGKVLALVSNCANKKIISRGNQLRQLGEQATLFRFQMTHLTDNLVIGSKIDLFGTSFSGFEIAMKYRRLQM
jgi:hypothetical protein